MVPHHGTNWAALRLTAQIGRDAVLSESYGRGCWVRNPQPKWAIVPQPRRIPTPPARYRPHEEEHTLRVLTKPLAGDRSGDSLRVV